MHLIYAGSDSPSTCAAYLLLSSTNRFPVKSTTGSGSQTRPVHYTVQGQAAHTSVTSCLSSSALGLDANLLSNFTNRVARRLICVKWYLGVCRIRAVVGVNVALGRRLSVFISKPVRGPETSDDEVRSPIVQRYTNNIFSQPYFQLIVCLYYRISRLAIHSPKPTIGTDLR